MEAAADLRQVVPEAYITQKGCLPFKPVVCPLSGRELCIPLDLSFPLCSLPLFVLRKHNSRNQVWELGAACDTNYTADAQGATSGGIGTGLMSDKGGPRAGDGKGGGGGCTKEDGMLQIPHAFACHLRVPVVCHCFCWACT